MDKISKVTKKSKKLKQYDLDKIYSAYKLMQDCSDYLTGTLSTEKCQKWSEQLKKMSCSLFKIYLNYK